MEMGPRSQDLWRARPNPRHTGRNLHDPGAEADPPIGQNLPLRESAADEFDDFWVLGETRVECLWPVAARGAMT
jgi:hypothetical protein